jgi:hypothetical protein
MYYTFVLFVNQHFSGLLASGTHCISFNVAVVLNRISTPQNSVALGCSDQQQQKADRYWLRASLVRASALVCFLLTAATACGLQDAAVARKEANVKTRSNTPSLRPSVRPQDDAQSLLTALYTVTCSSMQYRKKKNTKMLQLLP